MSLFRVTAPALEPVTLAEAVAHLRLDDSNLEPTPGVLTAALAGVGAGSVAAGVHRYRVTFVTAAGETDGGTISAPVTVVDAAANGKVALSAIPLGGSAVIARRIYRTAAGGSVYMLATTIADNTTTTATDNVADVALGVAVPATNTTSDPYITDLIADAREFAENATHRAFVTQTWRLTLDGFPYSDVIRLPRPNLVSVTGVTYVDNAGVTQTMSTDDYAVDTADLPGKIVLGYAKFWPVTRSQRNSVTIDFVAGYGAPADVPRSIKRAMLLLIGHWYANREAFVESRFALEVPFAVKALLGHHTYEDAS